MRGGATDNWGRLTWCALVDDRGRRAGPRCAGKTLARLVCETSGNRDFLAQSMRTDSTRILLRCHVIFHTWARLITRLGTNSAAITAL